MKKIIALTGLYISLAIGFGLYATSKEEPETRCEERVEDSRLSFGRSIYVPSNTTYERVPNQIHQNILEEIRIDRGGDGTIDDTIVFFTRRTGAILAENAVGIYRGFPLPDNLREKIRFSDNLTSDQYKERALDVLSERRYDPGALANFEFF